MWEEPNRLIRALLDPERAASQEENSRVLDHVARALFATRYVAVDRRIRGRSFLGRRLRTKEPSIVAHLAKRILLEEQWAEGTTPDQYLADLRSVVGDPEVRAAVYSRDDGWLYLGLLAPNRLPSERLGPKAEAFLWIVYSADYGTIVSGYQVSGTERITLPAKVRWL